MNFTPVFQRGTCIVAFDQAVTVKRVELQINDLICKSEGPTATPGSSAGQKRKGSQVYSLFLTKFKISHPDLRIGEKEGETF